MMKVSVSEECLAAMIAAVQEGRTGIETEVVTLRKAYQQAGTDWNDKKYNQLGDIIERASRSILIIGATLGDVKEKLRLLQKNIEEYINTGKAERSNNANAYSCRTSQTITYSEINGRAVSVFDHPNESAITATYGQGHCIVDGHLYNGTCGCCALSTLLRRTGYEYDEHSVVTYASRHTNNRGETLCLIDDDPYLSGGTSELDRMQIATEMGMPMRASRGQGLDQLANNVESGRGVIIAVEAGNNGYNPNGMYSGDRGGHAIVLNSVVRDVQTNEIVGYYVLDSNGQTSDSASIFVDANTLNNAYLRCGSRANVTNNIIW